MAGDMALKTPKTRATFWNVGNSIQSGNVGSQSQSGDEGCTTACCPNGISYPKGSTHHGQRKDSLDVSLDDRQLRHSLLQIRWWVAAPVVDVPHDTPGHRLTGEVLHLKVQLHDLIGSVFFTPAGRPGGRGQVCTERGSPADKPPNTPTRELNLFHTISLGFRY